MKTLSLNQNWRMHEAPMSWGKYAVTRVLTTEDGWLSCELPCDIHMPLQKAGIIGDVTKADCCYGAEWTEHRSWWFVNEFDTTEEDVSSDVVELTLESLDGKADIFLNDMWIGSHNSTHYPFIRGVKDYLHAGKNILVIRMTTGMECVNDEMLSEIEWAVCTEKSNNCIDRSDIRRGCLRKPQYVVGWDWAPKAITCGIVKDAYISCYSDVAIRNVYVRVTEICENAVKIHMTAELDQLDVISTRDCDFCFILSKGNQKFEFRKKDILLTSGINYLDMDCELPGAELWWPAGYGNQPMYDVDVAVSYEGKEIKYPRFAMGLRTIELDTSRADGQNRNFFFVVNGVHMFCKGGDWIPADSIYARISKEKYQALIDEAKEAGFNMLRIWGGGIYEPDFFYDYCDRCGLLLWHDFMFGCSSYPDNADWFMVNVRYELNYQTRRLRNHACMALWCGNNENHWIFNKCDHPKWGLNHTYEHQYGLKIANETAKEIVYKNCGSFPYWNSSPYGGILPNDETCGDTHHWHQCMMNADMSLRIEPKEYDKVCSRFVTEYGYIGPCCKESIADFFDGMEIDRNSRIWKLHNNTFEKDTVLAGIEKHYLDNAANMTLDDYLMYSGMVQSLMLEYSLEAIRFKDFCGGGLFWMYDDAWCEVGWTIIDYYLRRKISFYGVKRAFAPIKLSLRITNDKIRLQGCNDTEKDIILSSKVGYVSFDGDMKYTEKRKYMLKARSRTYLEDFDLPDADYTKGTFMVIPENDSCAPAVLRMKDTRHLKYTGAKPEVIKIEKIDGGAQVTLTTDAYIHCVYLNGNQHMSDNYFDLIPGQVKKVDVMGEDIRCDDWHVLHW